jgi:hypothetical protein
MNFVMHGNMNKNVCAELDILTYLLVVVVVVIVVVVSVVNLFSLKCLGLVVGKWKEKSQLYKEKFQRFMRKCDLKNSVLYRRAI